MHSQIVEPLLLFCTHAIRMKDTRCCNIMLRVFRSVVPDFQTTDDVASNIKNEIKPDDDTNEHEPDASAKRNLDTTPIPAATAAVIREYISSDVLKACITSIHEPYFVELQKDLASLIATILACYCPITATPRNVILSLPNMQQHEVDRTIATMLKTPSNTRTLRGLVLELLRDLKGVSISEQGKLAKSIDMSAVQKPQKKLARSKMAQQFMTAPAQTNGQQQHDSMGVNEDGLDGVAGLFNNA